MSSRLTYVPLAGLCLALLLSPTLANADKYAAEFMRIGVGARALGMGGAFTAVANDASTAYWNPAGMARLEDPEILFMHAEQFGDLATHDFFAYAQPMMGDGGSAVGISVVRFGVDGIQSTRDAWTDRNQNGRPDPGEVDVTRFRTESDVEWGVLFTYARKLNSRIDLGGNLKVIRQGLVDNTSFGMGVDLGVLYRASRNVALGLRAADITTTQISWDTGTREVVTPSFVFGASYHVPLPALHGDLTASVDLSTTLDGRAEVSQIGSDSASADLLGGLEYWFSNAVAVRAGVFGEDWTAGGGLRYRSLGADYAFLPHDDLGDTHRISASMRF